MGRSEGSNGDVVLRASLFMIVMRRTMGPNERDEEAMQAAMDRIAALAPAQVLQRTGFELTD